MSVKTSGDTVYFFVYLFTAAQVIQNGDSCCDRYSDIDEICRHVNLPGFLVSYG